MSVTFERAAELATSLGPMSTARREAAEGLMTRDRMWPERGVRLDWADPGGL